MDVCLVSRAARIVLLLVVITLGVLDGTSTRTRFPHQIEVAAETTAAPDSPH